jgi:hypothetical protein
MRHGGSRTSCQLDCWSSGSQSIQFGAIWPRTRCLKSAPVPNGKAHFRQITMASSRSGIGGRTATLPHSSQRRGSRPSFAQFAAINKLRIVLSFPKSEDPTTTLLCKIGCYARRVAAEHRPAHAETTEIEGRADVFSNTANPGPSVAAYFNLTRHHLPHFRHPACRCLLRLPRLLPGPRDRAPL